MSGVDERVETVREGFSAHVMVWQDDPNGHTRTAVDADDCNVCAAEAALDLLAAAVAGLEQRADDAEARVSAEKLHAAKAFRSALLYAGCGDDAVTVADRFVDAYSLAAAVVSAEPTEETA